MKQLSLGGALLLAIAGAIVAERAIRRQASRTAQQEGQAFQIDRIELRELSGLASSRQNAGWLWMHNDAGAGAYLYAVDPQRRLRVRLRVTNALARDWEDLALGPGPDGRDWLFIADTGQNRRKSKKSQKRSIVGPCIWVLPEPVLGKDVALAPAPDRDATVPIARSAPATRLRLVFPTKQPPDVEALFLYADGKTIGLVTKRASGKSRVYAARLPERFGAERDLAVSLVGKISLKKGKKGRAREVTAGTLGPAGLVLVTYERLFVVAAPPAPGVAPRALEVLHKSKLPPLPQAEACTLVGGQLLVASEGRPARFVRVPLPAGIPAGADK